MTQTTDRDFEVFQDEVLKWVKRFGLSCWDIVFEHSDRYIENRACLLAESGHRIASFFFTKTQEAMSVREVRMLARHEVLELLLFPLGEYAESRLPSGDLADITHTIIHQIEGVISK